MIAIDVASPACYRCGYGAGTRELFLAFDLGLAKEKPVAAYGSSSPNSTAGWVSRCAAAILRVVSGLLPVPHARAGRLDAVRQISRWRVAGFRFRFKEGADETAWDDAHRHPQPSTTPSR